MDVPVPRNVAFIMRMAEDQFFVFPADFGEAA
jgi:hypothetical protein